MMNIQQIKNILNNEGFDNNVIDESADHKYKFIGLTYFSVAFFYLRNKSKYYLNVKLVILTENKGIDISIWSKDGVFLNGKYPSHKIVA